MAGIHEVARQAGLKDEEAAEVFNAILARCKAGEKVILKGFGSFQMKTTKARVIASPILEGGKATVPAYQRLAFKASAQTRNEVKGGKPKGAAKGTPAKAKKVEKKGKGK